MGRLGVVTAPGRSWRAYAGPVAFLAAVTLVVGLLRGGLHHQGSGAGSGGTVLRITESKPKHHPPVLYTVRAGDTLSAISARTHIPEARLLKLNPRVSPTALFIGEKIRLR